MATGGSAINFERFAYDSFAFSMKKFYPDVDLPEPQSSENNYEHDDFLQIISAGFIGYQLGYRDTWKPAFVEEYKSNRLKTFKQISELLGEPLQQFDDTEYVKLNPVLRTHISIAVINETIQFLYSKDRPLFLNDLASVWSNYFARFQEDFKRVGGFSGLYKFHKDKLRRLGEIVDIFIPYYCRPYNKRGVTVSFLFHAELESAGLRNKGSEILFKYWYDVALPEKYDIESPVEGASAAEIQLPEGQSKDRGALTGSPLNPEGQPKGRGSFTESPLGSERQSKGRGSLGGSSLSPEGQTKGRGGLTGSPLSPEGQSTGHGSLSGSPARPEKQKHRRDSKRTPKSISGIEQKKPKLSQSKRTEPSD